MGRTEETMTMLQMMEHFVKNKPPMDFEPTFMYMGRVLDSVQGEQWYDKEEYQPVLTAILSNDKSIVADVCITQLVKATSKEQFKSYQKLYPNGRTFDQLDDLIKSSKKR